MLSRFKKIGQGLQKAGKSVEEGLGKAGKSVGKGIERASKSHESKSKAASSTAAATEEARTETRSTEAAAAATPASTAPVTPAAAAAAVADANSERGSQDQSGADAKSSHTAASKGEKKPAVQQQFARTPTPSPAAAKRVATPSPTPPLQATPPRTPSPAAGSEIHFDLESDGNGASPLPSASPPAAVTAGAPPKVPKERGGAVVKETVDAPAATGPAKQVAVVSHPPSGKVTPAESALSVHGSDGPGRAGGNSGVGSIHFSSRDSGSSIQFDVNTTASASPLGSRVAKAGGARRGKELSGLLSPRITSTTLDLVADDDADPEAFSPKALENTLSELDFKVVDESEDNDKVDSEDVAVDVARKKGERRRRKLSKDEEAVPDAASNNGGSDEGTAASQTKQTKQTKRRTSSTSHTSAKAKKTNSARGFRDVESDEEEAEEPGPSSKSKFRRPSRRDGNRDREGESKKGRRTRTGSSRRKAAASPSPSPSSSSSASLSAEAEPASHSPSSSAASSASPGIAGEPKKKKQPPRNPSPATKAGPENAATPHSARSNGPPAGSSRRRGSTEHRRIQQQQQQRAGSSSSYRSGSASRTQADVSRDVRAIFDQCRLDTKSIAPPPPRRRVSSPPTAGGGGYGAAPHSHRRKKSSPRDLSARRREGGYPADTDGFYDREGRGSRRDSRRGGGARDSQYYSPRRSRSPRGKYSGVHHGRFFRPSADYDSSASSSSGASYVSYDSQQRELYRGRPRGVRQRAASPRMLSASARRRRHLSPSDWHQSPSRGCGNGLVQSSAGPSSQRNSPWRPRTQYPQQQRSPSASSAAGRRGSGERYSVEASPMRRSSRYAPPTPVEYRVVRQQVDPSQPSASSPERSLLNEDEILEEVEYKLEVLAEQIAYNDFALEQDMMSSPFERLYHMNNRRDRNERREQLARFHKLLAIREKIVTGTLDREIAEREERQRQLEEKIRDPEGIFMRLYQSPRRRGAELEAALNRSSTGGGGGGRSTEATVHSDGAAAGAGSSRATSPSIGASAAGGDGSARRRHRSRSRTKAEQEEYFGRIYANAMAGIRRKQELAEEAKKEREQREEEDLLAARLAGRMQRRSPSQPTRTLSPEEILAQARQKIEAEKRGDKGAQDASALLQDRHLTRREEKRMADRLTKHGLRSPAALEAQQLERDTRECTFRPKINEFPPTAHGIDRHSAGSRSEDDAEEDGGGRGNGRSGSREHAPPRSNRFEELYRKGMAAKQRAADVQAQRDRELRLRILKSRLSDDHHFRKRVELDPALAERFMRSLEV